MKEQILIIYNNLKDYFKDKKLYLFLISVILGLLLIFGIIISSDKTSRKQTFLDSSRVTEYVESDFPTIPQRFSLKFGKDTISVKKFNYYTESLNFKDNQYYFSAFSRKVKFKIHSTTKEDYSLYSTSFQKLSDKTFCNELCVGGIYYFTAIKEIKTEENKVVYIKLSADISSNAIININKSKIVDLIKQVMSKISSDNNSIYLVDYFCTIKSNQYVVKSYKNIKSYNNKSIILSDKKDEAMIVLIGGNENFSGSKYLSGLKEQKIERIDDNIYITGKKEIYSINTCSCIKILSNKQVFNRFFTDI